MESKDICEVIREKERERQSERTNAIYTGYRTSLVTVFLWKKTFFFWEKKSKNKRNKQNNNKILAGNKIKKKKKKAKRQNIPFCCPCKHYYNLNKKFISPWQKTKMWIGIRIRMRMRIHGSEWVYMHTGLRTFPSTILGGAFIFIATSTSKGRTTLSWNFLNKAVHNRRQQQWQWQGL